MNANCRRFDNSELFEKLTYDILHGKRENHKSVTVTLRNNVFLNFPGDFKTIVMNFVTGITNKLMKYLVDNFNKITGLENKDACRLEYGDDFNILMHFNECDVNTAYRAHVLLAYEIQKYFEDISPLKRATNIRVKI